MKLAAVFVALSATAANADPVRLRADALATTASPAGLLVLEADGNESQTLSAEAVVWTAARDDEHAGDVLVVAVRARTQDGRARMQVGRFVGSLGALRPVHVDGASGRVRLPRRFDVEAYAGVPVAPGIDRSWDWVAGGRVSRRLGDWGSIGAALLEQRDGGKLVTEELGLDAGAEISKRTSAAARLAYDLATPGVADVALTASHRRGALRADVFAGYRAASHLVPATSLFSVLGDIPAERVGAALQWRAAPRLDTGGELAVRRAGDLHAVQAIARARLRLDDRGASSIAGELRRDGIGDDQWTGARASARIAGPHDLVLATELELVIPDHRDQVWPWGLVALAKETAGWRAAIAIEAASTPADVYRVDVLAQLGARWGTR